MNIDIIVVFIIFISLLIILISKEKLCILAKLDSPWALASFNQMCNFVAMYFTGVFVFYAYIFQNSKMTENSNYKFLVIAIICHFISAGFCYFTQMFYTVQEVVLGNNLKLISIILQIVALCFLSDFLWNFK